MHGLNAMPGWRRLLAIGTLAVLTACGGGGPEAGTGEPAASVSATSSDEPTSEPSVEPTEPESTGPIENKPFIKIASAPIGGNPEQGQRACANVNWLGSKPIPDGTTIKLGSIELNPVGIFELDQGSCGDDVRSCVGLEWKSGDSLACSVGVRQVAAGRETVYLKIPVTVTCENQADCDSVDAEAKKLGGSSVGVLPDPDFGIPSGSPPESPAESPPESPSEAPSESPTESPSNG
jgi:hypothetical protein